MDTSQPITEEVDVLDLEFPQPVVPMFMALSDLAENSPCQRPAGTKRCPFCGELSDLSAVLYGSTEDHVPTFRVMCGRCGAAGTIAHTKHQAWKAWNKRESLKIDDIFGPVPARAGEVSRPAGPQG